MRNKYNSIFTDVEVKLDLFHACQRVVRTVSPTNPLYRDMVKNFTQIFREDDDQGEMRLKDTPGKEKIERNLNSFLERWTNVPSSPLTRSTLAEIENLIDPVQRDGDCAFRSVVKEVKKRALDDNAITKHMESLQLSTLDEDGATFALRQLFVKELTEDNCLYYGFVTGTKEEIASKEECLIERLEM